MTMEEAKKELGELIKTYDAVKNHLVVGTYYKKEYEALTFFLALAENPEVKKIVEKMENEK